MENLLKEVKRLLEKKVVIFGNGGFTVGSSFNSFYYVKNYNNKKELYDEVMFNNISECLYELLQYSDIDDWKTGEVL